MADGKISLEEVAVRMVEAWIGKADLGALRAGMRSDASGQQIAEEVGENLGAMYKKAHKAVVEAYRSNYD